MSLSVVKASEQNPLGYEKITRLLTKYAVPSIISMLVNSLYNLVDQIFIGQGVGYLGNAATNVSFPLNTICLSISLLIGVGTATRFSLELGAGNKNNATKTVGNAFSLMIISGITYFVIIQLFCKPLLVLFGGTPEVLPYSETYTRITAFGMPLMIVITGMSHISRADGTPNFAMICMMTGAVINTVLDPVFIFVFKMGVAGAALATVISQVISFIIAINYIRNFKQIKLKKNDFILKLSVIKKIVSFGMSNSLNQVALTLVQIVLNNSLSYYGAKSIYGSEIPLASSGIIIKTNAILLAVIIGISQGAQPIIGFNYGAKQFDRVRKTFKTAILCNLVISILAFIFFQLFPGTIISFFGDGDPLYFEFATYFLRIFLLMTPANGIQLISANFFSAIGKPVKGIALSLTRQVILLIPFVIIFSAIWGLKAIPFASPCADFLAFCLTSYMILREFKKMK